MPRALDDIYDELAPAVTGYFRGRGARDPEDLCGDVFVSVAAGIHRFRGDERALRRWVFTIAHHRMVDEYRSAARQREELGADAEPSSLPPPDVVDPALLTALAALTDDQREVVVLRYVADLALRDVATIVGKRPGAVKMLQARALEQLRTLLDDPSWVGET